MLRTQIKASHITNLTDARYFAAWGVNWLSFQLDPAEDNMILPQAVLAIKEWVEGPKLIGSFGTIKMTDVQKGIELLGLDGIELSMFDNVEAIPQKNDLFIIKEIVVEQTTTSHDIEKWLQQKRVDLFQLNFDKNGISWEDFETKSQIAKKDLNRLCQNYSIILSIATKRENLDDLLSSIQPKGLNLKGGAEEKVGFKSFDELDDLFEVLEEE